MGSRRSPCGVGQGPLYWQFSARGSGSRRPLEGRGNQDNCSVDEFDPFPYGIGDTIGAGGRDGGRLGKGQYHFITG